MANRKGSAKTGGRKKGALNKVDIPLSDVKGLLRESLEVVGDALAADKKNSHLKGTTGPLAYFVDLAQQDPKTYAGLLGKLVPNALQIEQKGLTKVTLDFSGGKRDGGTKAKKQASGAGKLSSKE